MTPQGTATSHLESEGCTDVFVTRTGLQSFDYEGTCKGKFCTGELTLGGSTTRSGQTCSSVPPLIPTNVGPGSIELGKGNVTGPCARELVQAQLTRLIPRMEACYDLNLQTQPALEGNIRYAWSIAPTGEVVVDEMESNLPVVGCGRALLAQTSSVRPERGACRVAWTYGYELNKPVDDLGHERLPISKDCPNPLSMNPGSGETALSYKTLHTTLTGNWDVQALELWSTSSFTGTDVELHALADRFPPPLSQPNGAVEARETMLCHTQPLQFTVTTTTDADGKRVKTREIAPKTAATNRGNLTFPVTLQMDTNTAVGLRRYDVALLNGLFEATLVDSPLPAADATLSKLFDDLDNGEVKAETQIIQRSPTQLDMLLRLEGAKFELVGQATYRKR